MSYDFSQLNDKEFEILAADLISTVCGKRIERFKPGKDGGIDGRFFSDSDNEIILQCKHYLKTGYQGLMAKLRNEGAQKVKKIDPEKYLFVTSLPLSQNNKKEIRNTFHPHIKRDDDVFGQEDLNDLLAQNPDIEERHFKLWISSTTVLTRIINNAVKGRSEFEIEQIKNRSHKYILTENHEKALKVLKEKHVLIISGEPGIGKTTLAENLCLYFVSKDYEFVDIEESLSEAENIYTRGKKQIFFFDDFLGSNYFEAIVNKKDSHITKFIERIKNDKTKLLILTSRTNILNSGVLHSNLFANQKIRKNEFMLTIETLTEFDRAKILYNHIWFSELKEEFIDQFYEKKRYRKIIKHRNFNPRLIEFITDVDRINVSSSCAYWAYIERTLYNPKDIWSYCFKIQNNAFVRNLVVLTVFNGGQIDENELRRAFNRLKRLEKLENSSHTEKDFGSTSQLATKSFLNRNKIQHKVTYTLFNPSIGDFVLGEYCEDLDKLIDIFKSLDSKTSLEQLVSLERGEMISAPDIQELKNALFEDAVVQRKTYDYLIFISDLFQSDESKKGKILDFLRKIIEAPAPIEEFSKLLGLLMTHAEDLEISNYDFLVTSISNRYPEESEIKDLAEFVDILDIENEGIFNELTDDLEHFLIEELESRKSDLDLSDIVEFYEGYDGEQDYYVHHSTLEHKLSEIVESLIADFYSDLISALDIDIQNIVRGVDMDQMVHDYVSSLGEDDFGSYGGSALNLEQDIDDLFERS